MNKSGSLVQSAAVRVAPERVATHSGVSITNSLDLSINAWKIPSDELSVTLVLALLRPTVNCTFSFHGVTGLTHDFRPVILVQALRPLTIFLCSSDQLAGVPNTATIS